MKKISVLLIFFTPFFSFQLLASNLNDDLPSENTSKDYPATTKLRTELEKQQAGFICPGLAKEREFATLVLNHYQPTYFDSRADDLVAKVAEYNKNLDSLEEKLLFLMALDSILNEMSSSIFWATDAYYSPSASFSDSIAKRAIYRVAENLLHKYSLYTLDEELLLKSEEIEERFGEVSRKLMPEIMSTSGRRFVFLAPQKEAALLHEHFNEIEQIFVDWLIDNFDNIMSEFEISIPYPNAEVTLAALLNGKIDCRNETAEGMISNVRQLIGVPSSDLLLPWTLANETADSDSDSDSSCGWGHSYPMVSAELIGDDNFQLENK